VLDAQAAAHLEGVVGDGLGARQSRHHEKGTGRDQWNGQFLQDFLALF
jgi:hypothetical protein